MAYSPLVSSYMERLSLHGSLRASHATLSGLQHAHMLAIPFENLDVLLGRPIRLDLPSIADKLLTRKRGGYCFEHNTLFRAVLEELGFLVTPLAARVRMGLATRAATPPRTHMLLRVELPEGAFIADAGFGGAGPRHPMPLEHGAEISFGHERHRLLRDGQDWLLQGAVDDTYMDLYTFTLDRVHAVDFDVANHYTSTHPASRFTQHLIVRKSTADGSVSLHDESLVVRCDDLASRRPLNDRKDLVTVLSDLFGLEVPEARALVVPSVPSWT